MKKSDALSSLIEGYGKFRAQYLGEEYAAYRAWASKTQKPRVMIIACSDSRVNPAIITQASLGDIFMVNNVANLVPPYKEGKNTHHSTSSALEFAVNNLQVEHVIVFGHSNCGGIRALMEGSVKEADDGVYSFIAPWVNIARAAKEKVIAEHSGSSFDEQLHHCEREALLVSLRNLQTFPWLKAAIAAGKLQIHAWHFDVGTGVIEQYSTEDNRFVPLLDS